MLIHTFVWAACFLGQTKIEPVHTQNPVFRQVLDHGLSVGGQTIKLPVPRFFDGQTAEAQRAALREVAGSDRAADAMLRDSVTAPFVIKVHDAKADGATIRMADLWFVVHGDFKQIDPKREVARTGEKEVEVANMWFQARVLNTDQVRAAGIKPVEAAAGQSVIYTHIHAKLLSRIDFEVTNEAVASQSSESIVIASMSKPAVARGGSVVDGWKLLTTPGSVLQPYAGGISYAKISRGQLKPGALLVELHVAFVEPHAWFQGEPILRSKFSVVAQDQIRALRRELAKKRGQ